MASKTSKIQVIATTVGYPPQLYCRTLLLKISLVWFTEYREIKLELEAPSLPARLLSTRRYSTG